VVRVRKSLSNDEGLLRTFRVAPMRKDGAGRTKGLRPATPQEVRTALRELGVGAEFRDSADRELDPDRVAAALFGRGVRARDLLSAEQVAERILSRPDARKVVNDAVGNEMSEDEVPEELRGLLGRSS